MKLSCAVLTISDTRNEKTDESGQRLQEYIESAGHHMSGRYFAVDEIGEIREVLKRLMADDSVDIVITSGGTGITKRDITPEAQPTRNPAIPDSVRAMDWRSSVSMTLLSLSLYRASNFHPSTRSEMICGPLPSPTIWHLSPIPGMGSSSSMLRIRRPCK